MPELSEVEVARTRVESWWRGRAADEVRVEDDEVFDNPAGLDVEELFKREVVSVRRRGKYLVVDFEEDAAAIFHFRMTGKITSSETPTRRFTRLSWHVPDVGWLVFDDARRLGDVVLMEGDPLEAHPPLIAMGPEPHDIEDGAELADLLGGRRRRLKDMLLDQSVIAGVGNIAISELYWRIGLHPKVRANELTEEQLEGLASEMPIYFDWLVEDQMADEIVYLNEGKAKNPFDVYAREDEPCPRCKTSIERMTFGGRSTYYCPTCQPSS